jgi:hypothetical protein
MVQFYFLSVFFNLFGGYALFVDSSRQRSPAAMGLRVFLRDPNVRLVLGILSLVTGGFKFLTVMRGDIPVVGDFVPAVAGLAVGATLLLERFRVPAPAGDEAAGENGEKKEGPSKAPWFERLLLEHKTAVGLAGMIAGVVHFLFPMVLFL